MPNNCLRSFGEGKAQRVTRPLHHGRYKLEECLIDLLKCHEELGAIRGFIRGKAGRTALTQCTAEDKHIWLKTLPLDVSFWLGYNLLAGLLALKKEGAQSVDSHYSAIEHSCFVLVDRLQAARNAIHKNVSLEYQQMKRGGSLLEPLIEEAIEITRRALAVR